MRNYRFVINNDTKITLPFDADEEAVQYAKTYAIPVEVTHIRFDGTEGLSYSHKPGQ